MRTVLCIILVLFAASCSMKNTRDDAGSNGKEVVPKSRSEQIKEWRAKRKAYRKEKKRKDLDQVVQDAKPMVETVLRSITEDDYEAFIQLCNESMRSMYENKEKFFKVNKNRREKYGVPGAHPILRAKLQKPFYVITHLVKFSKVEKPVPVIFYLKKNEDEEPKLALIQYRFSTVLKK